MHPQRSIYAYNTYVEEIHKIKTYQNNITVNRNLCILAYLRHENEEYDEQTGGLYTCKPKIHAYRNISTCSTGTDTKPTDYHLLFTMPIADYRCML